MNKITQVTSASLKIFILALLFFLTAAPTAVEYGLVPNTNELGQASRNSSDAVTETETGVAPTVQSAAQRNTNDGVAPTVQSAAQRNTNDGVASHTNRGSMLLQPHGNEGIQHDGEQLSELNPFGITDQVGRQLEPIGQVAPLKMEDFGDEVSPTVNNNIGYEPAGQVAPLKMEDFGDE